MQPVMGDARTVAEDLDVREPKGGGRALPKLNGHKPHSWKRLVAPRKNSAQLFSGLRSCVGSGGRNASDADAACTQDALRGLEELQSKKPPTRHTHRRASGKGV